MIAVIADDLTGAAEIGGIALRHGLRVVMDTRVHDNSDTDVLVIATDSRSGNAEEAKALTGRVTAKLLALRPAVIFKKTDSLLRGHVGEELLAQMTASGKRRALLIPANPVLNRTVRNGIYYAGGLPLNESDLADAARKKIRTSDVLHLMGKRFAAVTKVISVNDEMPQSGLAIGNTVSEDDLDAWASRLDGETVAAGSGGFFNAVLKSRIAHGRRNRQDDLVVGKKIIYVCGSAFPSSKAWVAEARSKGQHVAYMPETFFCGEADREAMMNRWANDIVRTLEGEGKVIVAVGALSCNGIAGLPNEIRLAVAGVIDTVMQATEVDELVIEGGATASSIIEKLHYERFYPSQELAQGVLRMKVQEAAGLHLTMKPGSYQWPASIWKTS